MNLRFGTPQGLRIIEAVAQLNRSNPRLDLSIRATVNGENYD